MRILSLLEYRFAKAVIEPPDVETFRAWLLAPKNSCAEVASMLRPELLVNVWPHMISVPTGVKVGVIVGVLVDVGVCVMVGVGVRVDVKVKVLVPV